MGITVNGNITVKGDQIFDGGIKVVHQYGQAEKKEPLTEERLKEKVSLIRNKLENGRLWFPVCKFMMWEKMVPEGDFDAAAEIIKRLFPDVSLNAKDLSSLNVFSFRKELKEWNQEDSPIKDRTTFYRYKGIADLLYEL